MDLMESIDNLNIAANDQCSNIYLVDESLCLSKSYDIFNTNFLNISTQFLVLDHYNDLFYNIYTHFTLVSSKWLNAYSNVSVISASLNDAYSTMLSLSSFLVKPFELTYPTLIDFDSWYANTFIMKEAQIGVWLKNNFPPMGYALNQIIIVNVNLVKSVSYSFNFNKSYNESCYLYASNSVRCGGCGKNYIKCNHPDSHGHGSIPECNLCNNCGISTDGRSVTVTCSTLGGASVLHLDYNRSVSDIFIPRNIKIKYKNINNAWVLI